MPQKADRLLHIALVLAVVLHGSALLYNLDKTYDAFVHIFFADHYARTWFEPWEYRWYTGFPVNSYPPLSHQLIALLSFVGGLKFGFITVILCGLCFFVVGIYRFAQLWVPKRSAGYAALFAVAASSIVQTIHIYGQLPTIIGISCLTNALPEVYSYFRNRKKKHLVTALSILGVTVASHHVTTVFGIVFFIAPVIATALLDEAGWEGNFFKVAWSVVRAAFKKFWQLFWFFSILIAEMVLIIFPYWYWSKTDPITQVPIPHGSRDSFIEVLSSGLMFFLIPMGFTLLMLPYVFKSLYTRRNIFLALSFSLMLLLGTGGTTPLPKMILGNNAFNILTLDRFTFWASVMAIPFIGDFFRRLIEGDIRERLIRRYNKKVYNAVAGLMIGVVAFQALFVINFHKFRSLQPQPIDVKPILSFLERDQHERWRFMTLGFGDQMAWLSAQTTALSIDGNYHSARRVPEMTSQPLERLENSKFKGIQGVGSLQQFLTIPEKYYLKFIFSNDKFYDPILYFAGWERVQRLENGIMVWQKHDIPPLPSVLPKKEMPGYQKKMWGILPVAAFCNMVLVLFWFRRHYFYFHFKEIVSSSFNPSTGNRWLFGWMGLVLLIAGSFWIKAAFTSYQKNPETLIKAYYNALDFKYFKEAYSYFPAGSIAFDDYVLQLSVRDGLLASYGKLDSIAIKILDKKPGKMTAMVRTDWVTPLERYHFETEHELVKKGDNWFIQPPVFSHATAPDEHMEKAVLALHSQGKRTITTAATEHDDVLDRPALRILSSKLVQKDSQYVVVGEIQNVDELPAHITIEAELYDNMGRKLVAYNAKYATIHKVLPKEAVPFRIEFEETAWVKNDDSSPLKFNPAEFTAYGFTQLPASFKVLARAVVADKDMYRDAGVQQVRISNSKISGEVYNQGTDEISVPQVLFTYYDKDMSVRWVDYLFLRDGIRQQAREGFEASIPHLDRLVLISNATEKDFYVNGLPQSSIEYNYDLSRRPELIPVTGTVFYTRLLVNSYIGNPTIY
ncbi:hypothetical protein [Foetidibacter luteolus]|uniref:hypothetical protein n=1 Tax=Foetidibacter luteolus TaxID=2608880 RepID=UPI00129ADEAF|nr:hypothetical protein [Foetidibacter luteolus]